MVNRAMCYWYLSVKLLSVMLHCCSPGMWRGANDLIPVSNCGEGCWWWVSQSIVPSSQGGVQVYLMLPAVIVFINNVPDQSGDHHYLYLYDNLLVLQVHDLLQLPWLLHYYRFQHYRWRTPGFEVDTDYQHCCRCVVRCFRMRRRKKINRSIH